MLLLTASVTPALAEIGCFEDSVAHEQVQAAMPDGDATVSSDTGSDRDKGDQGGTGHCAFAHGHCGFVAPSRTAAGQAYAIARAPYLSLAALHLAAAPRDAPERPPQA